MQKCCPSECDLAQRGQDSRSSKAAEEVDGLLINNSTNTGRTPSRADSGRLTNPMISAPPPQIQGLRPLDIAKREVQRAAKKSTRYKNMSKLFFLYPADLSRSQMDRGSPKPREIKSILSLNIHPQRARGNAGVRACVRRLPNRGRFTFGLRACAGITCRFKSRMTTPS